MMTMMGGRRGGYMLLHGCGRLKHLDLAPLARLMRERELMRHARRAKLLIV